FEAGDDVLGVELGVAEPRIARHDALRDQRAWIVHVLGMPLVGILATDAGEIGPGALGTPLEWVVIHALRSQTVMAVAFHLVAECSHHLAVTTVATLADIDVPAGLFERRVGPHALHLLDRAFNPEQRSDLHDPAYRHNDQDADQQDQRVPLKKLVLHWCRCPYSAATRTAGAAAIRGWSAT